MGSDLKPCPFCAHAPQLDAARRKDAETWWVECHNCSSGGPSLPSEREALTAWNDVSTATARAEAAEQRAEALEREVARLRAAGRVIACQWRAVDDMEELNYFALCWDLAYPDSAKLECDRGVPAGLALGNDPSLQDLVAALRLMLAEAQPAGEVSNG